VQSDIPEVVAAEASDENVASDEKVATFSASQLCLASLLGVLHSHHRCLPDAITDAAFDAGKLLTPVRPSPRDRTQLVRAENCVSNSNVPIPYAAGEALIPVHYNHDIVSKKTQEQNIEGVRGTFPSPPLFMNSTSQQPRQPLIPVPETDEDFLRLPNITPAHELTLAELYSLLNLLAPDRRM
jgi:hypothetical protein